MASTLSHEQLTALAPLLGTLARLIAGGVILAVAELWQLIRGAGISTDPSIEDELRCWAGLLSSLYIALSEALRLTTIEALRLRGLSDAPILLAVGNVLGKTLISGNRTATTGSADLLPGHRAELSRLIVSVSTLDLGILEPSTPAEGEFDVDRFFVSSLVRKSARLER